MTSVFDSAARAVTLAMKHAQIAAGWRGAFCGTFGALVGTATTGSTPWRVVVIVPLVGAGLGVFTYWTEGRKQRSLS